MSFVHPLSTVGANPTENRPPVVMLLFSDVCECAPDLRGRSHVGHTLKLELVFFSVLHLPVAFPNKRLYVEWF